MEWLYMGFGLVIRFTELLQLITTSKEHAVTCLHTSQITIGHTRSSQSVTVFTSRGLVAASSDRYSPSCGFPKLSLSSATSFSQQLNPSGYLTATSQLVKLLLAFASTAIPGFSLLEIHDQDFFIPFLRCTGFEWGLLFEEVEVSLSYRCYHSFSRSVPVLSQCSGH
jgi:hypothetical protein